MEQEKRVVLIAMDGSEHSNYALKTYTTQFHKPENHVVIVFVATYKDISYGSVALIPGDPALVQRIVESEEEKYNKMLHKLQQTLEDLKLNGEVVRVNGEAGHGIIVKAKELNAEYIVVGSRGQGQVRRTILGSVSDYLVHHSHKPVVVVKMEHSDHHHHGHT